MCLPDVTAIHHASALTCPPGKVTQGWCVALAYIKTILTAGALGAGGYQPVPAELGWI